MRFFFLLLLSVLFENAFGQNSLVIKFELIDNKIILSVPTNEHKKLHIMFDSASNDFLLDSAVVNEVFINVRPNGQWGTNFINGHTMARFFTNKNLFTDTLLNTLYTHGSILDLKKINFRSPIKIDALIGINNQFKNKCVRIDFSNREIIISNTPIKTAAGTAKFLKLVYTDDGHEYKTSTMLHKLLACNAVLKVNDNLSFDTNMLFDTGYNGQIALQTVLDMDSLSKKISTFKTTPATNADDPIGGFAKRYDLTANTVTLGGVIIKKDPSVNAIQVNSNSMLDFGSLKTYCLVGVGFLKSYKYVEFDFIKKRISILE